LLNAKFWEVIPTLIWAIVVLIVLLTFRGEFKTLVRDMMWRIRTGAAIKIATFELGQSYIVPGTDVTKGAGATQVRIDQNGERWKQREQYSEPNRDVQVV